MQYRKLNEIRKSSPRNGIWGSFSYKTLLSVTTLPGAIFLPGLRKAHRGSLPKHWTARKHSVYQGFSWGCSSKRGPENGPLLTLALLVMPTIAFPHSRCWVLSVDSVGILTFNDSMEVEPVFFIWGGLIHERCSIPICWESTFSYQPHEITVGGLFTGWWNANVKRISQLLEISTEPWFFSTGSLSSSSAESLVRRQPSTLVCHHYIWSATFWGILSFCWLVKTTTTTTSILIPWRWLAIKKKS